MYLTERGQPSHMIEKKKQIRKVQQSPCCDDVQCYRQGMLYNRKFNSQDNEPTK